MTPALLIKKNKISPREMKSLSHRKKNQIHYKIEDIIDKQIAIKEKQSSLASIRLKL